jgi:hypothetical protein
MAQTVTTTQLNPGDKLILDNYTNEAMTVESVTEPITGMFTVTLMSHPAPGKTFKHQLVLVPADQEFTRK